ncbi:MULTISPECIES: hypothetical protein [Psychrobacter]|uniref:hypothetical protein n=1 Tax=Psychrobacter TaxID=497 RepID=UPI000C332B18|nr:MULTISPECIES: hypothetical protein [Psychrobacter]MBA6244138.1 hypothetical protein [Psychrobacter sp. Urea-trap-18]MBA6285224.1 hypothetical protein [Psychrobacter sp. Urea-trap-16]MBA6319205.1 hypothetical protein [Psychrobacter sp. Urea-trap-20]MBA6333811.1 hypothetical protein [Psychrobacter sp. Urea-trap-19]PKG60203.1 hypothetical protein CXF63_08645 [Psychrobacter sp. Choline-3u-12]
MTLTSISIVTAKKTVIQKTSMATAVSLFLTGALFAASSVHAAPEVTINSSANGSTTVVEQYSDGKTATITATPNGITMQDGMPYAVTQVTTVPRYVIRQSGNNTVVTQGSTTVTSVPVTDRATNTISKVDVITTPISTNTINTAITQVLPVASASQLPVINTPATTVITNQPVNNQPVANQIVSTSLETLQLTPTFSTPDVVQAQTKVMKILKNKDGREMAVPANHIAPGDVIEYHTTYTNTTAQPVNDINAMVSLPNGVQLVSLNSPLPTLATTGGDSYQTIQQVGNTVVIKENYSGLKWNLVNLDANAAQTVVIRAKVQ